MTMDLYFGIYHEFFRIREDGDTFFSNRSVQGFLDRLTRFLAGGENARVATITQSDPTSSADLPDRLCTWCKVAMRKRLVASGQFIHYTCPTCVFQHTTRRGPKPVTPAH